MTFIASLLATFGSLVASMGSQACFLFLMDEPECPKNLIK